MEDSTQYRDYPHAPPHLFVPGSTYFITASTFHRQNFFSSSASKDFLLKTIFEESSRWSWNLEAWAVMANHYHLVARAPDDAKTLKRMVGAVHSRSAIWLNKADAAPGRKVWYQYRDTCLTFQASYFARLNYVHNNPVKHQLCRCAQDYPWCSMGWFMREAQAPFRDTVLSFKTDTINVDDDF